MSSIIINNNVALDNSATGGQTIVVDEPTAASFNDEILVTGNNFQGHSSDGGTSWNFINPFLQPFAGGGPPLGTPGAYDGDQVIIHERTRNLWILLVQYSIDAGGTNVFRVAVSTSGTPGPPWTSFAFAPDPALGTNNVEFDRPSVATTNTNLYVSYNVFSNNSFAGANVFQIQLDALTQGNLTNAVQVFRTTQFGTLCLTLGATNEMFFASHDGTGNNPLTIFRWPDASGSSVTSFQITPSAWQGSPTSGPFSSPGPGGEWLARLDSRITAGWAVPASHQVGFLWAALPGPGRPQPYIKGAVIDTSSNSLLFEPDIFASNFAFAYPATCPNVNGRVGLSVFFGGGTFNPSHAVTWLDGQQWVAPFAQTRASTDAPASQVWGDYCSCAMKDPDGTSWVASGFTLQGGIGDSAIQPQYVEFVDGP